FCFFGAIQVTRTALAQEGGEGVKEKIKITHLDDLPHHTYPFTGKVMDLISSREQVLDLAKKVRADVEADLEAYEIPDATTLQGMYGILQTIDTLEGRYDEALDRLEAIRELEGKEAKKLTTGMELKAYIHAKQALGGSADSVAFKQAFQKSLAETARKLDWSKVRDVIQENKGRKEIMSKNLILGMIEAQIEPVVAQTGELSAGMAGQLISIYLLITEQLPLSECAIAVYQDLIDANKETKPDIWSGISVTLPDAGKLSPVLLAVWDSGTDVEIFKDRLYTNNAEKLDGKDTDGNGYIDDLHGIAYDIHANRTTGLLYPSEAYAGRIDEIMKHTKGFTDLQSSIDSPESTALKKHLAGLEPDKVKGFIEDLSFAGNYSHGTHVAGIMMDGNPFARLLVGRLSYDHHIPPVVRTLEWGERDGRKCLDMVAYFKQAGVRVVNMSWGESQGDAEASLEQGGIGKDAEERREIARKVFASQREGLYEAIKNAPEILFICAAGNSDNDVEFDEYIPSSFDLPNLLVVGAVDQAGDPTGFTSFGETVDVYANGFEVMSYVPGGARMKMSGTSMSSPNVVNLAGKLLAVEPSMTPERVIELIKSGATTRVQGSNKIALINPKRTLELVHYPQ
ncbi:MAG: S8 family serine peptidase, partial [Planctomycetota bacterium]